MLAALCTGSEHRCTSVVVWLVDVDGDESEEVEV